MTEVRREPCASCPYRQDVPSGVWAFHEYEKLRDYDLPTADQPLAVFACHATPDHHCHGWAVCHTSRGHEFDLLALRVWPAAVPPAAVPLFESGNDAADHGQRDIEDTSPEADVVVERLLRKYPRLRSGRADYIHVRGYWRNGVWVAPHLRRAI